MPVEVEPRVFHLATTSLVYHGVGEFLDHIGAPDWPISTDDDHSALVEICGRACYRSFGTGLNKNVTRVRSGNAEYLGDGILKAKHGSVLEHAYDTFAVCDVSRVVTHELVRHRAGTAFSQESGRFVRVDEIRYYMPRAFDDGFLAEVYSELKKAGLVTVPFERWSTEVRTTFISSMGLIEDQVSVMEKMLGLDHLKNFGRKKKLQSSVRRLAPNGMATTIIVTANHRAWRHIVSMRTSSTAEEEIRLVQHRIFLELMALHPNIYQDGRLEILPPEEGVLPPTIPVVSFANDKV